VGGHYVPAGACESALPGARKLLMSRGGNNESTRSHTRPSASGRRATDVAVQRWLGLLPKWWSRVGTHNLAHPGGDWWRSSPAVAVAEIDGDASRPRVGHRTVEFDDAGRQLAEDFFLRRLTRRRCFGDVSATAFGGRPGPPGRHFPRRLRRPFFALPAPSNEPTAAPTSSRTKSRMTVRMLFCRGITRP